MHDPQFVIALILLAILIIASCILAKVITPSQVSGEDNIENTVAPK